MTRAAPCTWCDILETGPPNKLRSNDVLFLKALHLRSQIIVKDLESNFGQVLLPKLTVGVLRNVSELRRDLKKPMLSSSGSTLKGSRQSQAALSAEVWLQLQFSIQLHGDNMAPVQDWTVVSVQ